MPSDVPAKMRVMGTAASHADDELPTRRDARGQSSGELPARVGSSSTRPGVTSDTTLDELGLDSILAQLADDAVRYLDEAGFGALRVELAMHVEYEP